MWWGLCLEGVSVERQGRRLGFPPCGPRPLSLSLSWFLRLYSGDSVEFMPVSLPRTEQVTGVAAHRPAPDP